MYSLNENRVLGLQWQITADYFSCAPPAPIKLPFLGRFIFTQLVFLFLPFFLLFFHQRISLALFLFFYSPDQTWGPTFHPILFFLSDHLSIHLSFICLIEVFGGSREVTGVCLPGPTVCLSNELETQGVSLLWR